MNQWQSYVGLLALLISLVSLYFSFSSLRISKRNSVASVKYNIIKIKNEINEAFARHKVAGPFARILDVDIESIDSYIVKTNLMLQQFYLLEYVFSNKDIIGANELNSYKSWAEHVLAPWIKADPQLYRNLKFIRQSRDTIDTEFSDWISPIFD